MHNAPDDAVDLEAANERLAHMNLNAPPTAEGQPEQTRTLEQIEANLEALPAPPASPAQSASTSTPTGRKTRSDAGQPRAAKPKPSAPEPVLGVAPKNVQVYIALGVDIATQEGQDDVAALIAIWIHNGRQDAICSLFAHLVGELVQARKEIASLTTPAA
jgi:hypothetical protein